MRTLVTGAAGFIGSTLVDRLLADGHSVVGVDDLSSGRSENIVAAERAGRLRVRQGRHRRRRPDRAARRHQARGGLPPRRPDLGARGRSTIRSSTRWSTSSARCGSPRRPAQAGVRKVVHTSSGGSIYGTPAPVIRPMRTVPVDPSSPYAASKVAGEVYLNMFRNLYGLQCSHIAPANVYGPAPGPARRGRRGRDLLAGAAVGQADQDLRRRHRHPRLRVRRRRRRRVRQGLPARRADGQRFNIGTGVGDLDAATAFGDRERPRARPTSPSSIRRGSAICGDPASTSAGATQVLGWAPKVDARPTASPEPSTTSGQSALALLGHPGVLQRDGACQPRVLQLEVLEPHVGATAW